jgi:uncharacterized membrane protein HdeD (DUF308 family)
MFGSFFLWLKQTCNTDPTAFIVMSVMCMVGAYMTRNAMGNPNGAFLIYPFLLALAVMVNGVFDLFGFFEMKRMDQWLIGVVSASVSGMVLGLSLFILLNRTINLLIDRHA